jgi:hypothetical protein
MTLFDLYKPSEINIPGWNDRTLKPPITFVEIIRDIKHQWLTYHINRLSYLKCSKFLVLRIFQRISYNMGWHIAHFRKRKSMRRRL